jgi:hypothetical protein
MKICRRCKIEKHNSDFNICSKEKDGLQAYCKSCFREYGRTWEPNRKSKITILGIMKRIERQKKCDQKRDLSYRIETNKRYINKNPEKYAAHVVFIEAKRTGKIISQPCEICGNPKSDGHHDDYSKPLQVRWLCRRHHIAHHWPNSPIAKLVGLPT